jgi:hypothetical protein
MEMGEDDEGDIGVRQAPVTEQGEDVPALLHAVVAA